MSICTNCPHKKIEYAPYIKSRVEVCTNKGKCDYGTKEQKGGDDVGGNQMDKDRHRHIR